MFKRTIYQELIKWSEKSDRKPLVLRGARQVGKTTIVDMLGEAHYTQFLKLNLEIKRDRDLFERNFDINELISAIYFHLGKTSIENGNTLLFIDEIMIVIFHAKNEGREFVVIKSKLLFLEEPKDIHKMRMGT